MRQKLLRLACLGGSAVLAVTIVAAAPARAAAPVDYVALGDSYSSGVGAPPYTISTCFRSPRSYAQLWADANDVSSFAFVACSGATTSSMTPQFSSLNADTDLVSITIGGNDVGFADTVVACVLGTSRRCSAAVDDGIETANTVLPGRLDATYRTIRNRAPDAEVVVLGYPRLVAADGNCLTASKRAALNRGADLLHSVIEARAGAAGFRYVDARQRFDTHGACGSSPWINRFSLARVVDSFHPNAAGYSQGYLQLLNSAVG